MIAELTGEIKRRDERGVVINVGGVGFLVHVTRDHNQSLTLGKRVTLLTHLAVRETSLDLYGFADLESLNYFELLITVPGIGPKSALTILSLASPDILRRAITSEDTNYLTRISGIGRKSAEKIILTLKDKLAHLDGEETNNNSQLEAIEALQALGYSLTEAREAMKKVGTMEGSTEIKLKEALKKLGRN